ncbi:hypothetical protein MKW98_014274 [Papaver atlanticum]|uniref:Uncharacterized protein n=1 Tax=Papaver atlanticum TaxID=357466 RepID=A0AAD4SYC6_9MAGN|nr:hypothetical protein MKW98_014274 [Papaver atlanticum]
MNLQNSHQKSFRCRLIFRRPSGAVISQRSSDNMARGPRSSSISHSHGRSPISSGGSRSHPSSEGEHSPSGGSDPWHEALCQTNSDSEPEISEESTIGDQRLQIDFNDIGQPIGPTKRTYATKLGKIIRNLIPPSYKS